jgi:hypothetical protein
MAERDRIIVVRQGDCLASLAAQHGLPDARPLYDHPPNRELRARRASPHVLEPGDVVHVPAPTERRPRCEKGTTNRYSGRRVRVPLELRLQEAAGGDLAGRRYELEVGGETSTGTLGSDGLVRHDVPASAQRGWLRVFDASGEHVATTVVLAIGHLDPADTESGVRGRLRNLGMREEADGDRPIEAFQEAEGLSVSGEIDPSTQDRLRERHGA